jgi:hypothetical protein
VRRHLISMQVHKLAVKSVKITNLDIGVSSLYLLAAPSTPDEVREAVTANQDLGWGKKVAQNGATLLRAVPPLRLRCDACDAFYHLTRTRARVTAIIRLRVTCITNA